MNQNNPATLLKVKCLLSTASVPINSSFIHSSSPSLPTKNAELINQSTFFLLFTCRRVLPEVTPGYLRPLIPENAPEKPDNWTDVMADIERVIMPGVTHWHSPKVIYL